MFDFDDIISDTVKLEDFKAMLRHFIFESLEMPSKNEVYTEWAMLINDLSAAETKALMEHIQLDHRYKVASEEELRSEPN
jgi:hypothetical protein